MSHHARHPATQAAGLIVMLDAAGRTIALLEERVDELTRELEEQRRENDQLEELLADARREMARRRLGERDTGDTGDTAEVTPLPHATTHDGAHDTPPPPAASQ